MTPIQRTVLLCVLFNVVVVGVFVSRVLSTPELSAEELAEMGVTLLETPRDIAPFALRDDQGEVFDNARLQGKWTFLFFGFTHCPDICPTTMAEMAKAYRGLVDAGALEEAPFAGVLVSVDPERDGEQQLHNYVNAFSDDFAGVRGDRASLAAFAQQLNSTFMSVPDGEGGYTVDHSSQIVIINPYGHYQGFVKMPHSAETLRLAYQSLSRDF